MQCLQGPVAPLPLPCAPLPAASLEPETKAFSGRKVRPAGMCAGAWLAGPDKRLRLPMNQLEVLGAGGDRAGWHRSHQPGSAPSRASPSSLMQVREGFLTNAGLVERKGCSSCAVRVAPALFCVCKPGGFLAPTYLGPSKRPPDPGALSWHLGQCMRWDVCSFWKLQASLPGEPALCCTSSRTLSSAYCSCS